MNSAGRRASARRFSSAALARCSLRESFDGESLDAVFAGDVSADIGLSALLAGDDSGDFARSDCLADSFFFAAANLAAACFLAAAAGGFAAACGAAPVAFFRGADVLVGEPCLAWDFRGAAGVLPDVGSAGEEVEVLVAGWPSAGRRAGSPAQARVDISNAPLSAVSRQVENRELSFHWLGMKTSTAAGVTTGQQAALSGTPQTALGIAGATDFVQ